MADDKPQQSLADYVVTALSPLLIMVLIGSLVFFLLEVLYTGQYSGRMQWALFFFVFGSVLIGRVAMMPGIAGRAGLYSLILGFLTWISLQAFVEYPKGTPISNFSWLINLGLVVLIWWSAQRLTWDCTYIDDAIDASGAGVLESAGLERGAVPEPAAAAPEEPKPAKKKPKREMPAFFAWVERFQRHVEERKKRPHTPGVWVVYFSLAALPLFGVGQSLIPPTEPERRRLVFWLLVCYTGSGLGLLLTTCFLGLRRYLRQRGLPMPLAMTGLWLTVGGLLIAALLAVGAILPRPEPEYMPLGELSRLGSPERGASKVSVLRGQAGEKGEGSTPGEGQAGDKGNRKDSEGASRDGKGKSGGKQQGEPNDKNGQQGSGDSNKGNGNNAKGDRSDQSAGGSGSKADSSSGEKSSSGKNSSDNSSSDRTGKSQQQKNGNERSGSGQLEQKQQSSQGKQSDQEAGEQQSGSSPPSSPGSAILSALARLSELLKWVVLGIIVVLIVLAIGRALLEFLANFTGWADRLLKALRAWWQGLFGWFRREKAATEETMAPALVEKSLPFASYGNPFHDGSAGRRNPNELVRYTFEAFQVWARERDLGRQPDETALEFTARVSDEVPALEAHGRRLANLYVRAAYANGALPQDCLDTLEKFWEHLASVVERPLSAV